MKFLSVLDDFDEGPPTIHAETLRGPVDASMTDINLKHCSCMGIESHVEPFLCKYYHFLSNIGDIGH